MSTTGKMPAALKRKWLTALLSGVYKQGDGCLRLHAQQREAKGQEKWCCLGVLCDVSGKGDWRQSQRQSWDQTTYPVWEFVFSDTLAGIAGRNDTVLPEGLRDALNITSQQEEQLVTMNDAGKSFRVIAQWIDRNL